MFIPVLCGVLPSQAKVTADFLSRRRDDLTLSPEFADCSPKPVHVIRGAAIRVIENGECERLLQRDVMEGAHHCPAIPARDVTLKH